MIRKIPASMLGVSEPNPAWFGNPANEPSNSAWTNPNWLKSNFHFSFAEYSNPKNQDFGILRVLNDDLVQPNRGFGEHPHREMEICTYIVEGQLTHQDSMGTSETLDRGAIQFMTAGKGLSHSEHNLDKAKPLRFVQMWIVPRTRGLTPNYGSSKGSLAQRTNQWHHMVSDVKNSKQTDVKINQDANIYVTELAAGQRASLPIGDGRQGYLLVLEGDALVELSGSNGDGQSTSSRLTRHDAAEVFGSATLTLSSSQDKPCHALIVEMAHTGPGRKDLP